MSLLDDLAAAFTAGGVVVAAGALWAQLVQRREQLAQRYDERYWAIGDRCTERQQPIREDARYLELCEDEYDAIRLGWVRASTWEIWHAAIDSTSLTLPQSPPGSPLHFLRMCSSGRPSHVGWNCPALQGISPVKRQRLRLYGWRSRRMIR